MQRTTTVRRSVALATLVACFAIAAAGVALTGCSSAPKAPAADLDPPPARLVEVAHSDSFQWTGVACSHSGRVFVNYPRWNDPMRWSVAEVHADSSVTPYPNEEWQSWTPDSTDYQPLDRHWICVQSVHVDDTDRLWVLDAGSPKLAGVVPGGRGGGAAKLVCFDLTTNTLLRTYRFTDAVAPSKSYLNDVRIDTRKALAYITDSGLGAIVVLDLESGVARRVLADHPSTKAESSYIPHVGGVGGRELRYRAGPNAGQVPQIHADGIALSRDRTYLYYQPITGRTLYRVPTAALRDPSLPPAALAAAVENLGTSVATDGMEIDEFDNLYLTAIEQNAVVVRRPDGRFDTLVSDPRLAWPDTIAFAPNNTLLVSTAQIHLTEWFNTTGAKPTEPYRIFAVRRAGP